MFSSHRENDSSGVPRGRHRAMPLLIIAAGCTVLSPACADAIAENSTHWSRVDKSSDFRGWRQHLSDVARRGRYKTNHFCIVVADHPASSSGGAYRWAYVYWRETSRLYTSRLRQSACRT